MALWEYESVTLPKGDRNNAVENIPSFIPHQYLQIGAICVLATGFLVLALFRLLFQCQFLQI